MPGVGRHIEYTNKFCFIAVLVIGKELWTKRLEQKVGISTEGPIVGKYTLIYMLGFEVRVVKCFKLSLNFFTCE